MLRLTRQPASATDSDVEWQKRWRRRIVHSELIMMHGHNIDGFLPPLCMPLRTGRAVAWSSENQAMRQLTNLQRRQPGRRSFLGSAGYQKRVPKSATREESRPQTAYFSVVRDVLNKRFSSVRPATCGARLDGFSLKKISPAEPEALIPPKKLDVDDGLPLDMAKLSQAILIMRGMRSPKVSSAQNGKCNAPRSSDSFETKDWNGEIMGVLRGEMCGVSHAVPTTVRIYISGTMQDLVDERQTLDRVAYPELRKHCHSLGLDFQAVDVRWGQASKDYLQYNASEITKSGAVSMGPDFVLLLGDHYGDASPVSEIREGEFNTLSHVAEEHQLASRHLLVQCYHKDENMKDAVYRIKPSSISSPETRHQLDTLIEEVTHRAVNSGRMSTERWREFVGSDVEREVATYLRMSPKPASNALCFCRKFNGSGKTPAGRAEISKLDSSRTQQLQALRTTVEKRFGKENVTSYEPAWCNASDRTDSENYRSYLGQFAADFVSGVKRLISKKQSQWCVDHRYYALYVEVARHVHQCATHWERFSGRQDILNVVESRIHDGSRCPLLIHGAAGSGKTALLSACVWYSPAWLTGSVTITRYIGLSQQSSEVRLLLLSICLQLCAVYDVDPPPKADWKSANRMARHLRIVLQYIAKHLADTRPLLIFLDGIDNLQMADRTDSFFWLPHHCPTNVHFVVTLSSHGPALSSIRNKIKRNDNSINLDVLNDSDVECMLKGALERSRRQLTPTQMNTLRNVCRRNMHPLYVDAMIERALNWASSDVIDEGTLPNDTSGVFLQLLRQLRGSHGRCLVDTALLYLSLLRSGLSEVELRDAIACSDIVLQEIVQRGDVHVTRVISQSNRSVERLLHDLGTFICTTQVDKKTLLTWTHTHYRDIFLTEYLGLHHTEIHTSSEARDAYRTLAQLFSNETGIQKHVNVRGVSIDIDCQVTMQPSTLTNIRKYTILPILIYHGIDGHDTRPMKQRCLCNFQWMLTKLKAVSVDGLLLDFQLVKEHDCEIELIRDFLLGARTALKADHSAIAAQLKGCLIHNDDDQHIFFNNMLVESDHWLKEAQHCLLVPMFACFPSPLAPCKTKFWGLTDLLHTDYDGHLAVMKLKDGSIEIWDLDTIEPFFQLPVTYDRTTPNIFGSDTALLAVVGRSLKIWDIESGPESVDLDLTSVVGRDKGVLSHFCHSERLQRVALHFSDDDFNQLIIVVDTEANKISHTFADFTVKDDLISHSATFTSDGHLLIFANVRNEEKDKSAVDYVYIVAYDMISVSQRYSVCCGEKTFDRLILMDDGLGVVTWKDCSLDVYYVDLFHRVYNVTPMFDDLSLLQSCSTKNGVAILAMDTSDVPSMYHVFVWNKEKSKMVQLFSSNLNKHEEMPTHFKISEEIHIALLLAPNTAVLSIWDLQTSRCLHSLKTHIDVVENVILKTTNPYSLYTCSNGEGLVKCWDFLELIHRKRESSATNQKANGTEGILRQTSSRQKRAKSVRFAPDVEKDSIAQDDNRLDGSASLQLSAMMQTSCIVFTADSQCVVVGSTHTLPVVWDTTSAEVVCQLSSRGSSEPDVYVSWIDLACGDSIVIGLVSSKGSVDSYPQLYQYQVWSMETGQPLHTPENLNIMVTACTLSESKDIAIVTCHKTPSELSIASIEIGSQQILQEIPFNTDVIPTEIHLSDDARYLVANNVPERGETSVGTAVFPLCMPVTGSAHKVCFYEYQRGQKYRFYGADCSLALANGLALSSGFNGDMQIWDIATCEYDNNLYYDEKVDDTRNTSLHNHRGKHINHLVLSADRHYLVCGVQDSTATCWDMINEVLVHTYAGHSSAVCCVAISNDNQIVLTGSSDFTICVWQLTAPSKPVCSIYIHVVPIDLKLSYDKHTVAAIGACKNEPSRFMMFKLINLQSGLTSTLKGFI